MGLRLKRKTYNSKIEIYYHDELNYALAVEVIKYLWLDRERRQKDGNFELIHDHKAKVYKMKFADQVYYVKNYTFYKLLKSFKNLFRSAEAVRYFKTGLRLMNAGIAIAEPVLALTCRRNLFSVDSIFVTKEASGVDLYYLLKKNKYNKELREKLIKEIASIWSKLVHNNLLHMDPWLENFMVYIEPGEDIKIRLIDIDNIYFLPFLPSKILLMRNLARLKRKQLNDKYYSINEINLFSEEFTKIAKRNK